MPLTITDEQLALMGLSERDARIEIACRLLDAQVIGKGIACKLCGLHRDEFDGELVKRGLPVVRYTEEMFEQDMRTLEKWRREDADRGQRHVSDSGVRPSGTA